jgi:hypothetical protein
LSTAGVEWDDGRALRQGYPPKNLADQQVRLHGGKLLAHEPLVDSKAK